MRQVLPVIAFLLCCLVTPFVRAQAAPTFRFTESPGPYAVGLKVVQQYDTRRPLPHRSDGATKLPQGERGRALQTLIWYPAQKTDAGPMHVSDYLQIAFSDAPQGSSGKHEFGPVATDALWAIRDAPESTGRFPLIVYAPGAGGSALENADLCEYLASHGYVVVASPSKGAAGDHMTIDLAGANAQASDISFLIGYAKTLSNADTSKVAVVGFSWGGLAGLFAVARDSRIDALVSLDGSFRYYPAVVRRAGDVHPEKMKIPMLAFTQGEISIEEQQRDFRESVEGPSVLNAWTHGDLVTVHMLGFAHAEFSAMNQRNEAVWKKVALKNDYGREDGVPGYAIVARYTLRFLDASLKHDPAAMAYLKQSPAEHGVPAHTMSVKFRPAEGGAMPLPGNPGSP